MGEEEGGDADEKWDWLTGVPTSLRFLAKSWRPISRGPGGLVTEEPGKVASSSGGSKPDYSGTVNMLAMLSKVRPVVRF